MKKILNIVLILGMLINPFIGLIEVKALEEKPYSINNLDGNYYIDLDLEGDNSTRTISISGDGDYYISCNTGSDKIDVISEVKSDTCIIQALDYGVVGVGLYIQKFEDEEPVYWDNLSLMVNIGVDNYLEMIMDNIPNELSMTMSEYWSNAYFDFMLDYPFYYNFYCEDTSDLKDCEFKATFSPYDPEQGEYQEKTKTIDVHKVGVTLHIWDYSIKVGEKRAIYVHEYDGNVNDLVWASMDNDVIKVNQKGEVTGISEGVASLVIYDSERMETYYHEMRVEPKIQGDNTEKLNEFISLFEDEVIIDVGSDKGYVYDISDTDEWYEQVVNNYFYANWYRIFDNWNTYAYEATCNGEICSLKFSYDGVDYELEEFTVTFAGINIKYGWYDKIVSVGSSFELEITTFPPELSLLYDFDEEFFEYDELLDTFTALKPGRSSITVISGGYTSKINVSITYDWRYQTLLEQYLLKNSTFNLPYKATNFTFYNIKSLENIIVTKLINEFENENLENMGILDDLDADQVKPFLKTEVSCLSSTYCTVRMSLLAEAGNVSENNPALITTLIKNLRIVYSNEYDITDIVNAVNGINSVYNFNFNQTLDIEKSAHDKGSFIIDELNERSGVQSVLDTFDYEEGELSIGGVSGDGLTYILSSENYYTEYIILLNGVGIAKINPIYKLNHILVIPKEIQIKTEPERNTYIVDYINNYYEVSTTVASLLGDDVYEINVDGLVFNIGVAKKEAIVATQADFKTRGFELSVGQSVQTELIYYPYNANTMNVTYESDKPSVATVDANGKITAVSSGFTKIRLSCNNMSTEALVAVNMSIEDILNDILNRLPNSVDADYYQIVHGNMEQAIMSAMFTELNKITNIYMIPEITYESGNYFVELKFNKSYIWESDVVLSNKKMISVTKKGIFFNDSKYYINSGQTVDIGLGFTEGTTKDFIYHFSKQGIASLDADGKLTGLSKGTSYVWVNDRTNQYYNYFYVYVDLDDVLDETLDKLRNEKLKVNLKNVNFADEYSLSGSIYSALSTELDIYSVNTSGWMDLQDCDDIAMTCTLVFETLKNGVLTQIREPFEYELVGIGLNENNVEIDVSFYTPDFVLYSDYPEDEVTLTSNMSDICRVVGTKIEGLQSGFCTVTMESTSGYYNLLSLIVDKEGMVSFYKDKLDSITEPFKLGLPQFSKEYAEANPEDYMYIDTYWVLLEMALRKALDLENDVFFEFNWDELTLDNELDAKLTVSKWYSDSQRDLFGNYYLDENIVKTIELEFTEADPTAVEIGREIVENVEEFYYLTPEQIIEIQLRKDNFMNAYKYSDFMKTIESYGPEFTVLYYARLGGEDEGTSFNGGTYYIIYDDVLVASGEVGFYIVMDLRDTPIDTNEEIVDLIKEKVAEIYVEKKDELEEPLFAPLFQTFMLPSMNTPLFAPAPLPEVLVEYTFDSSSGKGLYTVTVEDVKFTTSVLTSAKTTYVTGLNVSPMTVNLIVGNTSTITPTITPSNATNKTITWSTSNAAVATVSNGVINATGAGTATISAKTNDGNYTKTIAVTVTNAPAPPTTVYGDVNCDGKVNMADLIKLRRYFAGLEGLSGQGLLNADVNKDGKVNMADLIKLRRVFAGLEVI